MRSWSAAATSPTASSNASRPRRPPTAGDQKGSGHADRHRALSGVHRPGRRRALRGPAAAARGRGALRRGGARTGRRRQRGAVPRRHPQLRRDPGTGHRAGAWLRSADRDDDGRPAADRLAAAGARDDAMDDVGLHRGDDPRRRGHPGRAAGDHPLDDAAWAGRHGRQAAARGTDRARRQGRHRRRRLRRPRPRPVAGRPDRRPGAGRDDPALHRVRPAAAVRRRPPSKASKTVIGNARTLGRKIAINPSEARAVPTIAWRRTVDTFRKRKGLS